MRREHRNSAVVSFGGKWFAVLRTVASMIRRWGKREDKINGCCTGKAADDVDPADSMPLGSRKLPEFCLRTTYTDR